MLTLHEIAGALGAHTPRCLSTDGRTEAGVALLLREFRSGPEILFIERAERQGDPWSGHMAFPGGGRAATDADVQRAAERETQEEVGISLDALAPLGRLDDLEGRHAGRPIPLVISAFAYAVEPLVSPTLNHEVRDSMWFPFSHLVDPRHWEEYVVTTPVGPLRFPGIRVGPSERHVVWGLTYRFLESLLQLVGRPLPDRWPGGLHQM